VGGAVLHRKGQIRHDGGVAEHPGLYLMGMQFLRRRKSALIDGAGGDARDLRSSGLVPEAEFSLMA
jgi:putative flavoprotein involved in K+ transport